jgi:hypothetical protein
MEYELGKEREGRSSHGRTTKSLKIQNCYWSKRRNK